MNKLNCFQVVSTHSSLMVKGMLSLLTVCPHEVAHLRKELLIAARHILATELRIKFVPLMEKLFDENILLVILLFKIVMRFKFYINLVPFLMLKQQFESNQEKGLNNCLLLY